MTMRAEKLKERLRKLSALGSDKNPNEHERLQAVEMFKKICEQHNLEMLDLGEGSANEVGRPVTAQQTFKTDPWRRVLLDGLCRAFYCETYLNSYKRRGSNTYRRFPVIVGRPENIEMVCELFKWLSRSIQVESGKLYGGATETAQEQRNQKTRRRSFHFGAAEVIRDRCEDLVKAEAEPTPIDPDIPVIERSGALMIIRSVQEEANTVLMNSLDLIKTPSRPISTVSSARRLGQEYGMKVDLGIEPK